MKIDNGVDKFKNIDEIKDKFSKCINKANSIIPESRKNRTKINLYVNLSKIFATYSNFIIYFYINRVGTAGMRLLEFD